MTDALHAHDELYRAARVVTREVALNRRILREALACGDAFARPLPVESSPVCASHRRRSLERSNTPPDRRI
jgi:hypothetical protein